MATPDQCALAADGSLLDASAIPFYNDPDDNTPLPNSTAISIPLHPFFNVVRLQARWLLQHGVPVTLLVLQRVLPTLTMLRLQR